jgi:hypothetical protein
VNLVKSNVLPFALLLIFASNVFGQTNQCTLKLRELPDAPELFGFRMGMTPEQVKSRTPQVAFGHADEFGVVKTSINPAFDSRFDKNRYAGIRTISLDFLDGRLTSLWLGYDSSFKWASIADFVNGISRSLQLPDYWTPWKSRGQQLTCADFQMTVTFVSEGPSFHIVDTGAEQTVDERRQVKADEDVSEPVVPGSTIADKRRMVYYPEACVPPNEIKAADRITFKNKQDAEHAGYKRANQCE